MKDKIIELLNKKKPQFLNGFGCVITDIDLEEKVCEMEFDVPLSYCHSGDIIQGGFVTAMLDAVTSFAVFAVNQNVIKLATLELKVNFFKESRAGKLKATGKVETMGRSIAFISGELFDETGQKTANISTTAKIKVN